MGFSSDTLLIKAHHEGTGSIPRLSNFHMLRILGSLQRERPWQASKPLGRPTSTGQDLEKPCNWTALQGSHRLKGSPGLRRMSGQRSDLIPPDAVSISDLRGHRVSRKSLSICIIQPRDTGRNVSTNEHPCLPSNSEQKSILLEQKETNPKDWPSVSSLYFYYLFWF